MWLSDDQAPGENKLYENKIAVICQLNVILYKLIAILYVILSTTPSNRVPEKNLSIN